VGNIPKSIKRRDLEHVFSRYGQVEKFDCKGGCPTANITYVDVEDAIKAREKLFGAVQLMSGQFVGNRSDGASLPLNGRRTRSVKIKIY
jgi:RNA recognition motif-containing protein